MVAIAGHRALLTGHPGPSAVVASAGSTVEPWNPQSSAEELHLTVTSTWMP